MKAKTEDQTLRKFKAAELMPASPVAPFKWKRRDRPFGRWTFVWNPQAKSTLLQPLEAYSTEIRRQLELDFEKQFEGIADWFTQEMKRLRNRVTHILQQQNDPAQSAALKQLSEELEEAIRQIGGSKDPIHDGGAPGTIRQPRTRINSRECCVPPS